MTERATCKASYNAGFSEGAAFANTHSRNAWLECFSEINGVVAGWILLLLALCLNVIDLVGPAGDHLAFVGICASIVAIACVWFGMMARAIPFRLAWFVWNAAATIVAFVAWLFNHRDLWGISANVFS